MANKPQTKKRASLPKAPKEDCLACVAISELDGNEDYEVKKGTNHGLCSNHAQAAGKAVNRAVEAQGITKDQAWALLVKAGKALATTRRSSQDWFAEALNG